MLRITINPPIQPWFACSNVMKNSYFLEILRINYFSVLVLIIIYSPIHILNIIMI